jgi:hypothetical protein
MLIVKIGSRSGRQQNPCEFLGAVFRCFFDGQMQQRLQSRFLVEWKVDPVILRKRFRVPIVAGLTNFCQKGRQLFKIVIDDEIQGALLRIQIDNKRVSNLRARGGIHKTFKDNLTIILRHGPCLNKVNLKTSSFYCNKAPQPQY